MLIIHHRIHVRFVTIHQETNVDALIRVGGK